jgi:hypothetical protein
VAVLVAGWWLAGCGDSHPHAAVPASATTRPPLAAPTTAAPAGPYVWSRDSSPALAVGGGASTTIAAVQATSAGRPWLVAGSRTSASGATTATVWRSVDGATWHAEALTGPGVDSKAEAVTEWQGGTVVVGSMGQGNSEAAAVWISTGPNAPFSAVQPAELPVGAATMTTVASGGLGLFAAGQVSGRVAVWYSSNGTRWTRLGAAERVVNGATDPHVNSLTVASDGVYAAGWQRDGARIDAAVWMSADGVHWRPVLTAQSAFAGGGDRMITSLVAVGTGNVPTGFVAVGGVRLGADWEPASWISPNGASWSEPSHAFAMAARPQGPGGDTVVRAMSIATNGPESATLVAVGGSTTAQRLWRSSDGVHWAELALPAGAARSPGWTATLVGSEGADLALASGVAGEPHVLIDPGKGWIEPSSQPSVFGAVQVSAQPVGATRGTTELLLAVDVLRPPQVIDTGAGDEVTMEFLTSSDAVTWRAQPPGPVFAGATVRAITTFRDRFVAVGTRTTGGQSRAAAWASTNGITWEAAAVPTVASSTADGVCGRRADVMAVGAETVRGITAAAAWASTDGLHWKAARVVPAPGPAVSHRMAGCAAVGSAVEAYGTALIAGAVAPTTWAGAAFGAQWVQQSDNAFGGLPTPVADLAASGRSWLALVVADPQPAAGVADSPTALYASTDDGASWQPLDTTTSPWPGVGPPVLDELTWWAAYPVVAGQVDGRLAVWTGTSSH